MMTIGGEPMTRYGRLVVVTQSTFGRKSRVLCKCDCGTEKEIRLDGLKNGRVQSCGCLNKERRRAEKKSMQSNYSDILHKKFGRLLATGISRLVGKPTRIVCCCDCGTQTLVIPNKLRNCETQSCGCYFIETAVHNGKSTILHGHASQGCLNGDTPLYRQWTKIRGCCAEGWRKGAHKVCHEYDPRWDEFQNFLSDFGEIEYGQRISRLDSQRMWNKENCFIQGIKKKINAKE